MKSFRLCAGNSWRTSRIMEVLLIRMIGAKSRTGSYCSFLNRLSAAARVELVVIRIVWPSGAARAASAVPMTPIAPGRFSITNGWPSESCNCAPLQHITNAYAYGDIWSRPGLDNKIRSLVMLGMTAALNRPAEFGVHVRGARANGCSAEEIREVLLLIAMYCGIPAANDAHRLAVEAMGPGKAAGGE